MVKTTVVGSYPAPDWLTANTTRTALRDAVMAVLKTQELAGLDVITDGELNRFDPSHPDANGMIDYFVRRMSGVDSDFSRADWQAFRRDQALTYRAAPSGIVRGPVGEGTLNLPADFDFVRGLTDRPLKFTCTGPHMLSKVLTDRYYCDRARLAFDIASVLRRQLQDIDAAVIQIDEANISGHPEDTPWAADAINHVLDGIKVQKAVHICFGNYGGQRIQQGLWPALLPFLYLLHVDHLVLEFARRGYDELAEFCDLDPRIGLGIGVIDIKDNEVETPETVAQRIETIVRTVGEQRLHWVHPDCGFWMLPRSVADRKMRALVQGRDLFLGQEKK